MKKPDIRFVSGGKHDDREALIFIKELLKKITPARILLVTEYVATGNSINRLIGVLQVANLDYDVAILSSTKDGILNVKHKIGDANTAKVYCGSESEVGLSLYSNVMSGVQKSYGSLFPQKIISRYITEDHKKEIQGKINDSRDDIYLLAEETLKELSE